MAVVGTDDTIDINPAAERQLTRGESLLAIDARRVGVGALDVIASF